MGLLDRFTPKNAPRPASAPGSRQPEGQPVSKPSPVAAPPEPGTSAPAPSLTPPAAAVPAIPPAPVAGGVQARIEDARAALARRDRAGAVAIYEEALAAAGDRENVLLTVSGNLGVKGCNREIIDLIAPRYDARRHGSATGINLLQAYLALRDPEAAQHVLALLFSIKEPGLEERLLGFSNVVDEMLRLDAAGMASPAAPVRDPSTGGTADDDQARKVELVNISRPIWSYGLEEMGGLLPRKEGRVRRVIFGQLAVLGVEDFAEVMKRPEEELGRLSRGIPLWLAETLLCSANWTASASAATMRREHYGLFNAEWTPEHVSQLLETAKNGIDYVFTGFLRQRYADYELLLRLWEVKKFRERKTFTVRWTPGTADKALAEFHAEWCAFMEFEACPAGQGMAYVLPPNLRDYIEALGAGLTLFLVEKRVLPPAQAVVPGELAGRLGAGAAQSELASLLALSLHARSRRLGLPDLALPTMLAATPVVEQARQAWALE